MIRQILGEPLLHFALLGLLLFAAWSALGPPATPAADSQPPPDRVIVIDQARLDHLKALWKAQWKRDPEPQDVTAIIDRHLRQEVFYREALRMGLDRDDDIIRNRLAQKLEAVAGDLSSLMHPPTDNQLRAFYQEHAALFTIPQAFAFRQVLYLPAETTTDEYQVTLASLRAGGAVPSDRQRKLSVPIDWSLTAAPAIEQAFGGGFAQALSELPLGSWTGPVRSGLGVHLVQVTENQSARLVPFEEIREFVARQYDYYAVLNAQQRMFDELRRQYQIRIPAEGVPQAVLHEYARP